MEVDFLIIGAGIAGLRCGISLLHKYPKSTVIILEKYKYVGGRVVTFKKEIQGVSKDCSHVQWENGAGRIHTHHHPLVMSLVKLYGLHTIPLNQRQVYLENGVLQPNLFEPTLDALLPSIKALPASTLATNTLRTLLTKIMGNEADSFLLQFPYRAEVDTLRADLGIHSFEKEMGGYQGYCVVQEGLSAVIKGMRNEFETLGGQIFRGQTVVDLHQTSEGVLVEADTEAGTVLWKAPRVICALHRDALKQIPAFSSWRILSHLQMKPLVRIYAVFPVKNGNSWFSGIPRTVSAGPIRYFIPINPSCGTAMVSYTDGIDARKILKILDTKGEKGLEQYILKELRKQFSTYSIPDPVFFKVHPWYDGCTYWLPGLYDVEEASKKALHPYPKTMPGVYCCGESFSLRQAWMEGALEHADLLLKTYF
jgi:monoamine oxidase